MARSVAAALLFAACAQAQEPAPDADTAFAVLEGRAAGDPVAAVARLQALAASEPRAASLLGLAYYHGLAITRDRERALELWREAAAAGSTSAAYNAALELLRRGDSGAETVALLEQAAAGGDTLACFAAGTVLAGSDDSALLERAADWLQRAAERGYAPAQHNLAVLLLARDAPGDDNAARAWLGQAGVTFAAAKTRLAHLEATPASDAPTDTATASAVVAMPALPADEPDPATPSMSGEETHLARPAIGNDAWIAAQQPQRYTLQVAAAATEDALTRLLERVRGDRPAAIFLHRPTAREPWTAVIGLFDDYATARAALAALPPSLQSNAPWIRRFEVLQGELAAHRRDDP